MKKRIFYFNISYGCNSNCIFCYSHNTRHSGKTYNEIAVLDYSKYLSENNVGENDRIIINGGEPLLHNDFMEILKTSIKCGSEILVYTNGRLLSMYDISSLEYPVRFIIPIHGDEYLHDRITGIFGSYRETIEGLNSLKYGKRTLVDLKIILNSEMVNSDEVFERFIRSLEDVYYNNAIHLTKMAETQISIANHCKSLDNEKVSYYLRELYMYYKEKAKSIKIFDSCVMGFLELLDMPYVFYKDQIEVYFKDYNQSRAVALGRKNIACMKECKMRRFCKSAVDDYLALEICDGIVYEGLE